MPHLLAADLAATGNPDLRWMACERAGTCWHAAMPAPAMTLPAISAGNGANGWALTTQTRWRSRITWPGRCGTWAATPKPATWTRTPWTAAAGSWATTTPTP